MALSVTKWILSLASLVLALVAIILVAADAASTQTALILLGSGLFALSLRTMQ